MIKTLKNASLLILICGFSEVAPALANQLKLETQNKVDAVRDLLKKADEKDKFYSCDVEISSKDQSEKKGIKSAIPLRTYLSWSGQIGKPIQQLLQVNGEVKQVVMSGKLIPGAGGVCLSDTLFTLGFKPSEIPSLFVISADKKNLVDFCYVMGDAMGDFAGNIRFHLANRPLSKAGEYVFASGINYIDGEIRLSGEQKEERVIGDYNVLLSCNGVGKSTPIDINDEVREILESGEFNK